MCTYTYCTICNKCNSIELQTIILNIVIHFIIMQCKNISDQKFYVKILYQDTRQCVVRPKKPARNTREYIDRKKENAIFAPPQLCAALMKQDEFCCGHSLHLQHSTLQIRAKSLQAFPRYATSKIGFVSSFFFLFFFLFSHTYKNCYKTRIPYPIALKFGTQKGGGGGGGIKAHLCTNFGWNTISRQRVMSDYSRNITPICCHAYRVNRVWEEAENRWVNRLTIEPQTLCGLKEIKLKTRKIQRKNQQGVTITQPRLANKKRLLPRLPDKPLGVML